MKIAILIISLAAALVSGDYLGKNQHGVDIFSINLDLPAEQRFVEVSAHFKKEANDVLDEYLNLIPWPLQYVLQKVAGYFWWIQPEYYMEIQGMGPALGIDPKVLLMTQYVYEFSAFCTSVIGYDINGTIIHSRNLDFPFAEKMRRITYEGVYLKDGKELFRAVMFAGINGVMTGHRAGFSISLNERRPSASSGPGGFLLNIANIFLGYPQVQHVIRQTLEECESYTCAFNKLSTTRQIAPSYYALSGNETYEGAIITRDRMGPAHIDMLSSERWYVAQTNDDHWTGVCTLRCTYVHENLDKMGREGFNGEALVNVLSQWPSNNAKSIYNVLMINERAYFDSQLIANEKPA